MAVRCSCRFLILRSVHTIVGNEVYYFCFPCPRHCKAAGAQKATYNGLECFHGLET